MYSFIYENKNGTETCFTLRDVEEVQHERAEAERELHSRESVIAGYHVEHGTCEVGDRPGQSHETQVATGGLTRRQKRLKYWDDKMNDLAARNRAYQG